MGKKRKHGKYTATKNDQSQPSSTSKKEDQLEMYEEKILSKHSEEKNPEPQLYSQEEEVKVNPVKEVEKKQQPIQDKVESDKKESKQPIQQSEETLTNTPQQEKSSKVEASPIDTSEKTTTDQIDTHAQEDIHEEEDSNPKRKGFCSDCIIY